METAIEIPQQEEQLEIGLQRLWARRMTISSPLPNEETELGVLEDLAPAAAQDVDDVPSKSGRCTPTNLHVPVLDISDGEHSDNECQEELHQGKWHHLKPLCLDAATIGGIPARYIIPPIRAHEFPVVGLYVDPRVVPGFRYRVRTINKEENADSKKQHYLFDGQALTLLSIGRGYSHRLTFQADPNRLNCNGNYFWSDSHPDGFAFELEIISPGDKFTLHDVNHVAAGTIEILENQASQEEVSHVILKEGSVEKTARVRALCKVEWFDNDQSSVVVPIRGLAVAVKVKGEPSASITKVVNVVIGSHRGFSLTPGINDQWRHTTVYGEHIGDVPTKYTITGLEAYELPVIGTYVDPRIMPGFHYRVRPAGSKRQLFNGRSLKLVSVGPGYGKRITFEPDPNSLNSPCNFLWSDSHPDGLGFEPRAVHAGMKFEVLAAGQRIGEGSVFRADAPQQEENHKIIKGVDGTTVVKYIHVDVTCHIALGEEKEHHVMRVSGTAVVARDPQQTTAQLIRIENVGLDSQLNLLFVTQHSEVVFHPL